MENIILGDCLTLMGDIPDGSVDMILCDLPYGSTACKWDIVIPFDPLWKQYKRVAKKNAAIVLTACQPFTSHLVLSNLDEFRYEWIWEKEKGTNFITSKVKPMLVHENVLVFYQKKPTYNPQMVAGKPYKKIQKNSTGGETHSDWVPKPKDKISDGFRYPRTVQKFSKDMNRDKTKNHPTQKPVALFEYLIKTYTNEGDLVLDNCCGSGTTGVAAINTNRKYLLIEKDETYYEIAKKRLDEAKSPIAKP